MVNITEWNRGYRHGRRDVEDGYEPQPIMLEREDDYADGYRDAYDEAREAVHGASV